MGVRSTIYIYITGIINQRVTGGVPPCEDQHTVGRWQSLGFCICVQQQIERAGYRTTGGETSD